MVYLKWGKVYLDWMVLKDYFVVLVLCIYIGRSFVGGIGLMVLYDVVNVFVKVKVKGIKIR